MPLHLNLDRDAAQQYNSSELAATNTSKKAKLQAQLCRPIFPVLHSPPTPPPNHCGRTQWRQWRHLGKYVQLATSDLKEALLGTHRPRVPLPTTFHQGNGILRLRQPGYRGDADLLMEYSAFSTIRQHNPNEKLEVRRVQVNKNLHYSIIY